MRLTLFETFIGVGRIDPAGGGTALSSFIAALPSTLKNRFLGNCNISPWIRSTWRNTISLFRDRTGFNAAGTLCPLRVQDFNAERSACSRCRR
jgi:hypothetical protein